MLNDDSKLYLRGGSPQDDDDDNISNKKAVSKELLMKFNRYKEKTLNDTTYSEDLSLYIELITTRPNREDSNPVELSFEIQKHFLDPDSSKILLLTGRAGAGSGRFDP